MTDFDPRDQAAYAAIQSKLIPLWKSIERLSNDEQTIVVVPSVDIDVEMTASEMQAYEERYLFLLLLLRQPRARMVYVTGQAINPDIVDYYLDLMPGVLTSHARSRLFLLSPIEATWRPLTNKILERPKLIDRISSLITDKDRAHLVPFMTTWADRELAMRLGIPMYGADPADAHFGTKTEGRQIFAEVGIPHPAGREGLSSKEDVAVAIASLRAANRDIAAVVIKHDEGVPGFGNATVRLSSLPEQGDASEHDEIMAELDALKIAVPGESTAEYFEVLEQEGGIVEELTEADDLRSPSVQLRITPLGDVELLSTHDQILGGESGQLFIGSRFPADPAYATLISTHASAVGARLAERGVIGRFAIDFVVFRNGNSPWEAQAIELNLRKGGTTHPFLTLQFLTDGNYDAGTATFQAPSGLQKFYVASDHVAIDGLRTLTPRDVLDIALIHGLHFDQARQVGSVFHMLSILPEHGQLGLTSVGDSPAEAQQRYEEVVAVLTSEVSATTK